MARHKGIPSRARVGFAGYFFDGWLIDHEIAEVWDGSAERWRLVEPEIDDDHTDPVEGARASTLLTRPRPLPDRPACLAASPLWWIHPEPSVTDPDPETPATRGWPQLRHNLVHDLAALNKTEMLLWEDWGAPDSRTPPGPGELPVLDELATLHQQLSRPLKLCSRPPTAARSSRCRTVISYSLARADVPAGPMSARGGPAAS